MVIFRLNNNVKRYLSYLRVSITDRCNLRCIYCRPEGCIPKLNHSDILTYEEILKVLKVGFSLGIKKIRITGGEPLTRKGISNFISKLLFIKDITDLSLTTNGVLLFSKAEKIKKAGVKRINVSLDSLDHKKYEYITGYNKFYKVWDGVILAHNLGFYPIKINVVVIRNLNDNEIFNFARLTFKYPFHIRFIEYMPIGFNKINIKNQILIPEIKNRLLSIGNLKSLKKDRYDGPAKRFKFDNSIGEIGFISPISHHFCYKCNRLRLTADGRLRSCLLSDKSLSLKDLIKKSSSDLLIAKIFINSARNKIVHHCLDSTFTESVRGEMYNIGG